MLIGLALLACLLVVPLLGGRLTALADLRFAAVPAVIAAIALQIVIISLVPRGSPALHHAVHVASYGCAAWFVWANRRLPGMPLIAVGGASNLLAIAANGGVMPASAGALRAVGREVRDQAFLNSAAVAHPHLQFLGDVLRTPAALPFANVFSVGDVALVAGAFVLMLSVGRGYEAQHPLLRTG